MKAYYMANFDLLTTPNEDGEVLDFDIDASIKQNDFAYWMGQLGLERELTNANRVDSDLLKIIERTMMSGEHSDNTSLYSNELLLTKIKNYFDLARTDTKKTPKAELGAEFGFTPGSKWQLSREFQGPSHAKGGIDVNTKNL